jgi:hypothetical protein
MVAIKENIVYKLLGLPEIKNDEIFKKGLTEEQRIEASPEGFTYIGDISTQEIEKAAIEVCREWDKVIDECIEEAVSENAPELVRELRTKKFMTYPQYLKLFDKPKRLEGTKYETKYYKGGETQQIPKTYYYEEENITLPFGVQYSRCDFLRKYTENEQGFLKLLISTKVPIRAFFMHKLQLLIPQYERRKHTHITGGSGSGKSEFLKLFIYSDLKKTKNSTVLIEPHGDLSEQTAKLEINFNDSDRLVYLDARLKKGYTWSLNPFHLEDKSEMNIERMTQALITMVSVLVGTELTSRMETMLTYCLPILLLRKNSTFYDLKRFMDVGKGSNNQDLIEKGLNSEHAAHREYFSNDFLDDSNMKVTKTGIRDRISKLLAYPTFARITTGQNTIDLEHLLNNGKLVIFNVSKGSLGDGIQDSIGAMVVGMCKYYALSREDTPERDRKPTNIVIDEFQNFTESGKSQFQDFLSETRKYAMYLTIANQYDKQVNTDVKTAIDENVRVKIVGNKRTDDELKKLRVGQFKVTCGTMPDVTVKVPDFLCGNKGSMTDRQWKHVKKQQIEQYYRKYDDENDGDAMESLETIKDAVQEDKTFKRNNEKFRDFKPEF